MMDLLRALLTILTILLLHIHCCRGTRLQSGQIVCRNGKEKPCYKIIYFHDTSRRLSFQEAQDECRRDGGDLMTIKSEAEQELIQKLIRSIPASDGDFWLGLRRIEDESPGSSDCQSLYSWVDGSKPTFWNWYADEPSCGSEVCVVMYYQPFASPGVGGQYMFQWNDDRCNMKNNFICKYSEEMKSTRAPTRNGPHTEVKSTRPPTRNGPHTDIEAVASRTPDVSIMNVNQTAKDAEDSSVHFILIATIPVVTLLMIFLGVVCCCIIERRKQHRSEVSVKEPSFWLSPNRRNSPNLEIYNVIKKQTDADLAGTRPDIQNTSFRGPSGEASPPDNLSGDYDNIGGHHSESGFVTLASTESGFVTNELYELSNDRYGRSTESGWVENEIYG
ncbi:layilin isoform 2-T2 [Anomaloglossus baeobatrachus]|uniref:layilin isoform X2 n=1 Tax=Anomaloglossus baeobatrachus TaxID=238106 RepID=UPI003F4FA76F